jgi:hypothetical protein
MYKLDRTTEEYVQRQGQQCWAVLYLRDTSTMPTEPVRAVLDCDGDRDGDAEEDFFNRLPSGGVVRMT